MRVATFELIEAHQGRDCPMKADDFVSLPVAAANVKTTRREFIAKTCAATVGSAIAAGVGGLKLLSAGRGV